MLMGREDGSSAVAEAVEEMEAKEKVEAVEEVEAAEENGAAEAASPTCSFAESPMTRSTDDVFVSLSSHS